MDNYSLFNKLISPLLVINNNFDVLFLNRAAKEAYSYNPEKTAAAPKCFRISHGYDVPCYERGERCPVKELKEESGKNIAAVNHIHKDGIYKVETYRDDENKYQFFEFHTKIPELEYKVASLKLKKEIGDMAVFKELFYDNSYVMLILDPELKLMDINEAGFKFYRYNKKELIGKPIYDTIDATKEIIDKNINLVLSGKQSIFCDQHKLKNGEFRDVQISLTVFYFKNIRYVFAMILDITERILIENMLKESEELFRTLANNMPAGLDMHREKFIYANPSLQNMLGYTEEEFKNMYFWDIVAEEHKETAKKAIKKGIVDINYKHYVTFKVCKKTGEELWMYIYAGSVIYKGEPVRIATFTDITELINLRKQLELEKESYKDLSVTDALTGIFNRRKFEDSLEDLIKLASRYKRQLSLLMFDIDRFKEVNDTFGHQAGDSVLRELTGLVGTLLRNTDIFARYGGEEFMVIMPETDIKHAKDIAERIRKTVENHVFQYVPSITVSLGVSRYADGEAPNLFIKRVDAAMYNAKSGGRNRVGVLHYINPTQQD